MDLLQIFNAIEAGWWIGMGALLFLRRFNHDSRWHRRLLAILLIVFGASDLIEIWSGAWWRPWWLAALKIACGLAIAVLALQWFRRARSPRLTPLPPPDTMP